MPNSKVGQYQIEYRLEGWTGPARAHNLRMWVAPDGTPTIGAAPSAINIMKKGGTTGTLQVVADQAWSFFRLMYTTGISATSFSLWRWATNTARDFITAGVVGTPLGTGGSINVASQKTLTFRHALGGIGKIVFLEANLGGSARIALVPNAAGTSPQRIAAYLLSADSPMIALDNSFAVASLRDSSGENEAIFKLVNRSGS